MKKKIILLADNEKSFLKSFRAVLEREGYDVITATNPEDARAILETQHIDLAILDLRLTDDENELDVSGLDIAKEMDISTPKIILTAFPAYEDVKEALAATVDHLPPAIDFLWKGQDIPLQLKAIRDAFRTFAKWFRITQDEISDSLEKDYDTARREATIHFKWGLVVSLLFVGLIIVGIVLAFRDKEGIGIATAVGGTIVQICNYLFFARIDKANDRVDRFHQERLQAKRLENLLAGADQFLDFGRKQETIEHILRTAVSSWLNDKPFRAGSSRGLAKRGRPDSVKKVPK